MRVIARSTLRAFWTQRGHRDAEQSLRAWHREAEVADWSTSADVKRQFGSASILRSGRVVFNIAGNKYRLVVAIRYDLKIVFIRFVGTHSQYDQIDVEGV